MEIYFADPKLERIVNTKRDLVRKFGDRMATLMRRRLDDMDAADSLENLRPLPGRYHELIGDRTGQLSADLVHPLRLIFEPLEKPYPEKPSGGMDWSKVKRVIVVGVEDTHE